jgi:TonB-dependent starch-binding outer membrane protein SusC
MKHRTLLFLFAVLCFTTYISGQNSDSKIIISGVVNDSLQRPIKGAAIFIDYKKTEQVTDKKGRYKIKSEPGARKILVLTAQNQGDEVLIDGRTTINFTLSGKKLFLPDSIINIRNSKNDNGSDKTRKNTANSDKASINEHKYSKYTNIYDLIRTELTDVQVTGNSILVRGYTSLTGSSQPIFVVDGVIMQQIDDVIPGNVKSIKVLKGQSAAIYGMRGANGVIEIITFKDSK